FEALFERSAGLPYVARLEGGWDIEGDGRFTFLGVDPYRVFEARGDRLGVLDLVRKPRGEPGTLQCDAPGDPFKMLEREYQEIASIPRRFDLPFRFQGGAIGYLGYGLRRFVERVPERIA